MDAGSAELLILILTVATYLARRHWLRINRAIGKFTPRSWSSPPVTLALAGTVGYIAAYVLFANLLAGDDEWVHDLLSNYIIQACCAVPMLVAFGLTLSSLLQDRIPSVGGTFGLAVELLISALFGFAMFFPIQITIIFTAAL